MALRMARVTARPLVAMTAAIAVVAGAVAVGGAAQRAAAQQETAAKQAFFTVDGVHSAVFYAIGHMGVAKNYGMFFSPEGTYLLDPNNLAESFIDISISLEHLQTGNSVREKHLQNQDFFNASLYPKITYTARTFKPAGEKSMLASGELTMLGVSKPVSAKIEIIGEGKTRQGYKSGFEAFFTIKRSDFGMMKYLEGGALGDEVELRVAIEGAKLDAE